MISTELQAPEVVITCERGRSLWFFFSIQTYLIFQICLKKKQKCVDVSDFGSVVRDFRCDVI